MASYSIAEGDVAVHDKTLVAATVDTVSFTGFDPPYVVVVTDGAAAIYVTTDGTAPTVSGSKTKRLPPFPGEREIRSYENQPIKLISAGTPTYSVQLP